MAEVVALVGRVSAAMARLDPDVVTVDGAMVMLESFNRIGRMAATASSLVARRAVASPSLLKHKGFKDGTDYLARTLDISPGDAQSMLGVAEVLHGLDATTQAAKQGELSPRKLVPVASAAQADPGSEAEMLRLADGGSVKDVQERSRQVRRVASPETDEQRALRAQRRRRLWDYVDEETGDGKGGWQLPIEVHVEVLAAIRRVADGYFEKGRRCGEHDDVGAYMADAFVELVRQPAAPRLPVDRSRATPDPDDASTDDTLFGQVDDNESEPAEVEPLPAPRTRRNARPIYRIDATAIDRGTIGPGETCEAAGVGPIPLDEAVELTASDAFKTVVATDPDDGRIVAIANIGRRALDPATLLDDLHQAIRDRGVDPASIVNLKHRATALQEAAVMWQSGGRCQIRGCTSGTGRLEIDHVDPYATSHHTTLEHLALLCGHCHDLKTYQHWTVGPLQPDGKRDLTPPDRPGPDPPDTA